MEKLNNLHSSSKHRINNFTMKSYLYEDNDFNHLYQCNMAWFGFPMLNATFNNISVRCIVAVSLSVEETRGPGENHRPVASH